MRNDDEIRAQVGMKQFLDDKSYRPALVPSAESVARSPRVPADAENGLAFQHRRRNQQGIQSKRSMTRPFASR